MERKRNYIYPDLATLAAAFACEFANQVREQLEERNHMHIALSGGSTALPLFRQLVEQTTADDWSNVSLYWVDERCVPSDHADSNYGMAKETLLEPLGLPQERIHRIKGEVEPAQEADRYGGELLKFLPNENGFPVFDWIWLGMGADGHTASIFPQQIELWTAGSPCVVSSHPVTAQPRITLTGGVINGAKRVSIFAAGKEKAPIIREIFLKEGRYMEYPTFYVNPGSGDLEWYLDQDAANLL